LFDETIDISHSSQLSLTVRYIHDGAVREDFLTFLHPHKEVAAAASDDASNDGMASECGNDA